ncbi:MAG: SDR family oxidoreductase [Pseudomonadota bacterium]
MSLRSILITGGSSGIGAALARAMAARGCEVLIAGRRSAELDDIAGTTESVQTRSGDITEQSHRAVLADHLARMPAPRALFHGAGFFQIGLLDTLSPTDWQRSFDVNVTARWELSRLCAASLESGRLLFIGSDAGRNPRHGAAAYSIAQSASETLRRALQAEWAQTSIAVSAFKPGLVDTPMVRGFLDAKDDAFPARRDYLSYVARGELTTPETVAAFAAWLLCDVESERFRTTEWDIRDNVHHAEWLTSPLYLPTDART